MYLMLQQAEPTDFVLSTGATHSVREFVELAFKEIGVGVRWSGSGVDEKGYDDQTGKLIVKINPKFYRPAEVDLLIGDASLAKDKLGWESQTSLEELCGMMVRRDVERLAEQSS